MTSVKGLYCLEVGEWFGQMRHKHSVEPALELLARSPNKIRYLHRGIATESEFRFYLNKWVQEQQNGYPLLYLAFHGSRGVIDLKKENGRSVEFPIADLFQLLEGKCRGRIIHFGGCGVIDIHGHTANRYLRQSGALALTGYADEFDWTLSAYFEMLFFNELQNHRMTQKGMINLRDELKKTAVGLVKKLGFRMRIA